MTEKELKELMKEWAEEDIEDGTGAKSYNGGYGSFVNMMEISEDCEDIPKGTLAKYGEKCYKWYLEAIESLQ